MPSIFAGIITLSASMAVVDAAQAEKHGYMQAVISNQPRQVGMRLLVLTGTTPSKTF